jgi:HK97 family phage major capsid protein
MNTLQLHQERLDVLGSNFAELRQQMDSQKIQDSLSQEKMMHLEQALDNQHALIQKMQTASLRPSLDTSDTFSHQRDEQKEAFFHYIRKGADPQPLLTKSMNASEGTEGGFLVPQGVSEHIQTLLKEESFLRKIARVTTISHDALEMLIDKGETAVGWVQEKDSRDETNTPELTKIRIPVHELYARPRTTQRLLDDAFLNVESWLAEKISAQMAEVENTAFISGNGDGKPRGFLDYERSFDGFTWGKIQSLSTGVVGDFPETHGETALIDLFHTLKPAYLSEAVWVMSRTAQAAVRKLKDPNSLYYLWQPSLSHEVLPTLMGYPVYITDHMPPLVPGQESPSIVFGNFKQAYQIVDRQGVRILRDPYSAKPYVEFYTTKRVGGDVVNFEALKILCFQR